MCSVNLNVMASNYLYTDITGAIIESYFNVYNKLGFGFLESVYQRAMVFGLSAKGFKCDDKFPIKVYYSGQNVGNYVADILVNEIVVIEIKAASELCEDHEKQLINYLKATDLEVGLLLNFGVKPQFKRKVFSGEYKMHNKS